MNPTIEKRLKRQVIGKHHHFEIIVPLGFEQTIINEIKNFNMDWEAWDGEESNAMVANDGKVEFTAKITEAWKITAYSRIANRILMKIADFKAENFGQLEKHAAEVPWDLYLPPEFLQGGNETASLNLHTTCKHSRLYHSGAVEERIKNIILQQSKVVEPADTNPKAVAPAETSQHMYIRLENDRCSLWLDLAGEELYKRGHQRFVAEAPLKETIAAAMIFEASKIQGTTLKQQGTSVRPQVFVDPMAGSGTFSLEVAYIANGLIPGKCRDFALKHQPAFKEGTWNFILKGASRHSEERSDKESAKNHLTIITSDISERPVNIIKHNVECCPLTEIAKANPNAVTISPRLRDFFSYTIDDICAVQPPANQSSIILLNPPYGKRLAFDAPKLYTKIGQKLSELNRDAQSRGTTLTVAILAPKDDTRNGARYTCTENLLKACPTLDPRQNTAAKLIETSHGGFSLNAIIAKV